MYYVINNMEQNVIKRLIKIHKNINLVELEEKLNKKENPNYLKIKIIRKRIIPESVGDNKRKRINAIVNYLKEVVKKYPNINTTIFCNLGDWSNKDEMDLPIFVFSAHEGCKNFLMPDYLFLADYSKNSGRNSDNDSHDGIVLKHRNKIPFIKKEEKCFFRGGTKKNRVIMDIFYKDDFVDARWSQEDFLPYEKMFEQKYTISHYMKWDSIYFFLKSDILVFLYDGFKTYLWYDLYLEDGKHYLKFNTKEEFYEKYNKLKNPEEIIKNSSEICDKYFTYENAIDYMGLLLMKYQGLIV